MLKYIIIKCFLVYVSPSCEQMQCHNKEAVLLFFSSKLLMR